jgi:hypothetical protein
MPLFGPDPYDPSGTQTYHFFNPVVGQDHSGPFQVFFQDVINLVWNSRLSLFLFWPPFTVRQVDELYPFSWSFVALIWFTFWSVVQFPILLIAFLALIIAVGVVGLLTWIHSVLFWKILHGPPIQVYPPNLPSGPPGVSVSPIDGQRWIYINGIATGKALLRQNIELLSKMFKRPILGINNRTYGFLGDILECVVQRSFGFRTAETRIALPIIRAYLQDPQIYRVVFIAHSQGGLLASHILDDLYTDLAETDLRKLEVYTFGSAALHFKNPPGSHNPPPNSLAALTFKDHLLIHNPPNPRAVSHMEHYCNEFDMVTTWGALSSSESPGTAFLGDVFVAEGATGHLLNQFYLYQWFGNIESGIPIAPQQNTFMTRSVVPDPIIRGRFRLPQSIFEGDMMWDRSRLRRYLGGNTPPPQPGAPTRRRCWTR